jgi:hypothetical protein
MKTRWLAAAVAVAAGVSTYLLLPPSPVILPTDEAGGAPPIRGVVHVHTRRSDGTGTLDEVAAAAQRAGLTFVIFTDHGDGTRGPDTPVYRNGVLCIDAVEISTRGGHIVALGLPQTPFPLGGEVRDVIEDVRRLGGMSVAAHPDSVRAELRLTDWDAPFDGVEWLNGDSQWRDEEWPTLGRSLLTYPFRRAATLATLLDRPEDLVNRWDHLLRRRQVVGLAAADAHARVGPGGDPYGRSLSLHVPAYEQMFRTLSISLPRVQLRGDAGEDAQAVVEAIRQGHVYSSIDALASPAILIFEATSGSRRAGMGDRLMPDGPVALHVRSNAPGGSTLRLLSNGKTVVSGPPPELDYAAAPDPAVYRVEIDIPNAPGNPPIPWLVSNPIYLGAAPGADTPGEPETVSETVMLYTNGPADGWRVEKSVRSEGTIDVVSSVGGTQILLRYGLGGTLSESPYVAAVVPAGSDLVRFDRITFTARAMQPMRLTFEVRAGGPGDRRWGRSVYLDQTARTVTIPFSQLSSLGTVTGPPVLEEVGDLLFVVDTVHSKQGASGQVWFDEIQYVR